jgi:hypothetical protein
MDALFDLICLAAAPECREDELCPWDILNKYKVPSMPCCTELRDSLLTICKGKSVYEIEQELAEGGAIHENGVVNLGIGEFWALLLLSGWMSAAVDEGAKRGEVSFPGRSRSLD